MAEGPESLETRIRNWDWLMTRIPAQQFGDHKRLRCYLGGTGLVVTLISEAIVQDIDILRSLQ